jgi:hypothetical protein
MSKNSEWVAALESLMRDIQWCPTNYVILMPGSRPLPGRAAELAWHRGLVMATPGTLWGIRHRGPSRDDSSIVLRYVMCDGIYVTAGADLELDENDWREIWRIRSAFEDLVEAREAGREHVRVGRGNEAGGDG